MKVFSRGKTRQRGAALLVLAAVLILGASWMLLSALDTASRNTAAQRVHNARVLAEAKAALIAWVASNALDAANSNPGRLPCPEPAGHIGSANYEGIAAPYPPSGATSCSNIGRLPWRTLGLDKLRDAAGEPLWYVVTTGANGWALQNTTTVLSINSNKPGQLTLDGQANAAVAVIIAPGRPMNVSPNANQTAAGCAARIQARNTVPPNYRDYFECQDPAAPSLRTAVVDNATNTVFNDQVLAITAADILPALEAAIARRIERDIVPQLKGVYAGAEWGLSSTNPVFPFAAPFANPGPGTGTSSFQGAAGTFQGLLPFNQTQGCSAGASNPRCLPSLVAWSATPANPVEVHGYGWIQSQSCSWESADVRLCEGEYHENNSQPWRPIRIEMTATFTSVAMGLRMLDATKMQVFARDNAALGPWQPQPVTYAASMSSNGSVTITFGATLPNIDTMDWGTSAQFQVRLERSVIADHPLLSSSAATTGWFVRNEWYRLVYYATAPNHAASGTAPRSCNDTTPTCLQVANLAPASRQRSILVLAGRSLTGATRPNGTLDDFLDSAENRDGDSSFEQLTVNASFNDRVVVLDANP